MARMPVVSRQRHLVLLSVLAGLIMALSIFDWVVVTSLPLLRNPAAVCAMIFVGLYATLRSSRMRFRKGAMRWALGFLVYTLFVELLRPIVTEDAGASIPVFHYLQWVQPIILFIIIHDISDNNISFRYIWGGVLVAGVFMAVMVDFQVPLFTSYNGGRRGFSGVNLNREAYWYALTAISLIGFVVARWPRLGLRGVGCLLSLFLVVYALLGTASRGGFLTFVAGLAVYLLVSLKKKNVSAYLILIPFVLSVIFMIVVTNDLVIHRLAMALSGAETGARDDILEAAWPLIWKSPWIGYGPRYTLILGYATDAESKAAHNTFAQIALTFGVPALFLWLCFVAVIIWNAWRSRGNYMGGLILSLLVCTLAYAMVGDLGYNRLAWVLFALAANVSLLDRDANSAAPSVRRALSRSDVISTGVGARP